MSVIDLKLTKPSEGNKYIGVKTYYGGAWVTGVRLEEVLTKPDYLKVMYFLAKENPQITASRVAEKFEMHQDEAARILSDINYLRLARCEPDNSYTLTNEGLAVLYNLHKNFAEG